MPKIQGGSNGGSTEEPSVAYWQWANVWGCSPLEVLGAKALGDQKSERHYRNVTLFVLPLTHGLHGIPVTVRGDWTLSEVKVGTPGI